MTGFLTRVFGPKRIDPTNIEAVINAYGQTLGKTVPPPRDVNELPATKHDIKAAILTALKISPAAQRGPLIAGFVALADFQPMSDLEKTAVQDWNSSVASGSKNVPSDVLQDKAKKVAESGPIVQTLLARISADANALMSELRAAGY